jgi:Zn-dependent metalloprotease
MIFTFIKMTCCSEPEYLKSVNSINSDNFVYIDSSLSSNEGLKINIDLYSAYLGKVNVNAFKVDNTVYLKSSFLLESEEFQTKVIDIQEHPSINTKNNYNINQLLPLKTASVDIDTNKTAYILSLIVYKFILNMTQELDGIKHVEELLSNFNISDMTLKLYIFCKIYCKTDFTKMMTGTLSLKMYQTIYGKCCNYNSGVDVLFNTENFIKYLFNSVGKIGIHNKQNLVSLINVKDLDNAYYTQMDYMIYGAGKNMFYPLVSPDIIAHELTHGLTRSLNNLEYKSHSGALNESFSDIMASGYEFYLRFKSR